MTITVHESKCSQRFLWLFYTTVAPLHERCLVSDAKAPKYKEALKLAPGDCILTIQSLINLHPNRSIQLQIKYHKPHSSPACIPLHSYKIPENLNVGTILKT